MPKHRNGPIRVGDLVPEIVPALVVTRDGEEVTLSGYVSGDHCPGRVKAQMAAVGRRYNDRTTITVALDAPDPATGDLTSQEFRHDPIAYRDYLAGALDACIIGLEMGEVEVLAGREDDVNAVLRYLAWLPDEDAEAEEDDDPEAKGEGSTSENSSPNSPSSTASDRASS